MRPDPLLLLDVDGVISLFGFGPSDERPAGTWIAADGFPHLISAAAARLVPRLARSFDLVWATGWEERANEHLLALLGLPAPLPVLRFDHHGAGGTTLGHWKLAAIDAFAGPDRALAWIDDAHDEACERWATTRPGPTLLVTTNPATGITEAHATTLEHFASQAH
jgi:hypothetical protein